MQRIYEDLEAPDVVTLRPLPPPRGLFFWAGGVGNCDTRIQGGAGTHVGTSESANSHQTLIV